MAETAPRVALLARPGPACERLQAALRDAGAEVVLVADPMTGDAGSITASGAQAVLVALEPSVEDALDRFEAVLADPAITVIFDEAELAAQREGWEAARWARHLAAKLNRHSNVLPPGAEADAADIGLSQRRVDPDQGHAGRLGFSDNFSDKVETLATTLPSGQGVDTGAPDAGLTELDWSMAPMENDHTSQARGSDDDHATRDRQHDMDDLQQRIASMELVDAPAAAAGQQGAVVVLAGIGGPDAVRQLLAGLPAEFPRPVLIQQRLDGARHDKLVRQMQRATPMPVQLAESGQALQRGHVYVLPTGLGVVAGDDGLRFGGDGDGLFGQLPPADSAVIVLSGSDPAVVDAAMGHALHGALVAGQSSEGCYDATAAEALITRGAESGTPAELASKLAARWPA